MTLRILREYVQSVGTDSMVIKSDLLQHPGPHLFIASHKWDEVHVELHAGLQPHWLHYLPTVAEKIYVEAVDDYKPYMNLLVELFPEKSGSIRRATLQGTNLADILGESIICKA